MLDRVRSALRDVRERAGLTQDEIAFRAGLPSQQAVSYIERRAAHLPPPEVWRVYVELGLDPVEVLSSSGYLDSVDPVSLSRRVADAL